MGRSFEFSTKKGGCYYFAGLLTVPLVTGVSGWMVWPPDVPDGRNCLGNLFRFGTFEPRLFVPMPGNMGRPAFTFINLYIYCNLQRIINKNIHLGYVCTYIFFNS